MSDRRRLRVGVYNRFWATAGGGEKFAGGIAQALATEHEVTLVGHGSLDLADLGARLSLELGDVGWLAVEQSPTAVEAASAGFDLFVNVSYGSVLRNRAPAGIYVAHFPTIGAPNPTGWKRFALRVAGRLAKLRGTDLEPARWLSGAYAPEPLGPLTQRLTDGDGVLSLRLPSGGGGRWSRRSRPLPVTLVLGRYAPVDGADVPVTVRVAGRDVGGASEGVGTGREVGRGVVRARSRLPLRPIRARMPAGMATVGDDDAVVEVHVTSPTHVPQGRVSDQRVLGVSVVAVLAGPWWRQALQFVHQPLTAAAADLSFLDSYGVVASNSAFTAQWVRRLWGVASPVLYPPVAGKAALPKERVILHVGRFFPPAAGHSKRQLELVAAFGRLVGQRAAAVEGWTLHLVGGCDGEGRPYLDEVRASIGTLPVVVHPNAAGEELNDLYGRASIYWHATGLGMDPDAEPDKMEHFGISTVEAMSAGAVPVCIGVAGQLEAFDDGVEGFHFATLDELVARTSALLEDPALLARMSGAARARARRYDEAALRTRLFELVDEVCAPG